MQCVREHNGVLPPPHIFLLLSQGGEGKAPPTKKRGGKGGSHPLPPPRDLDFSPSDEVAGHNLTGSRDSLVAAAPPGRSEQNRLNPPPLTVNDASEGFSFL